MASPATRGWGNPGRAHGDDQARAYGRAHIVTITTSDGSKFAVRREVAHLFLGFLNELIADGYRIKGQVLDDWGWYVRLIDGTDVLSNHSWGLAIDVNALTNPQGRVLVTDMPDDIAERAARWGLRWGGTYSRRPDGMHFEFMGRPEDVARYPLPAAEPEDDLMAVADDIAEILALVQRQNHVLVDDPQNGHTSNLTKAVLAARAAATRAGTAVDAAALAGAIADELGPDVARQVADEIAVRLAR